MTSVGERLAAAVAGRYRVEREIGAGGMATVFLAEDLKHRRQVAVKVLRPDLAAALGPDRFLREIEVAARLQHPHILTLIDSGEADGLLYYVMPFVEGESLRAKLAREGELPVVEAIRILREVADALDHAHTHGVVHRDIKPDNVLLSGHHAAVADFGVAKAVTSAATDQSLSTAGIAIGTLAYMAPEQAAADPHTDHRADIYAFGVMAYEMLAGRPPFAGAAARIVAAHLSEPPEPVSRHRPAVPAPLAQLVMRCLEKKPADRWQSAEELVRQLEAIETQNGEARSTAGGAAAPISRVARYRVFMIGLVATAIIVVGSLVVFRLVRGPPSLVPKGQAPVLAVLPFENLGAAGDEYFADGMTAEITSRLARLSGLAVIARTSAIQYKKTTKSTNQVSQELGAHYLLEGTVRWEKGPAGSRVRISPQLIRATDGVNVWAEPYEEPYGTEIFKMQAAIAERVAQAMSVTLLAAEHRAVGGKPTENLEAYDYYLRGRQYLDRNFGQDWAGLQRAVQSLESAVAADSQFALGHAWLAQAHVSMWLAGYDLSQPAGMTRAQRFAMVDEAVNRALRIEPDLPEAHVARLWYLEVLGDRAGAAIERAIVIRSQPSDAPVALANAFALLAENRNEEAAAALNRAALLDPRAAPTLVRAAHGLWRLGRLEDADRLYQRATVLAPENPRPYTLLAWFHLLVGKRSQALDDVRRGATQAGLDNLLVDLTRSTDYIHLVRVFDQEYGDDFRRLAQGAWGLDTVDYLWTKAMAHRANPGIATVYWDSLGIWAAARAAIDRDETDLPVLRAMALAGAGQKAAALRVLRGLPSDLVRIGWSTAWLAAEAYALMGEYDAAIDQLEALRSVGFLLVASPGLLQTDPIWDPLRQHPRFKKLQERQ